MRGQALLNEPWDFKGQAPRKDNSFASEIPGEKNGRDEERSNENARFFRRCNLCTSRSSLCSRLFFFFFYFCSSRLLLRPPARSLSVSSLSLLRVAKYPGAFLRIAPREFRIPPLFSPQSIALRSLLEPNRIFRLNSENVLLHISAESRRNCANLLSYDWLNYLTQISWSVSFSLLFLLKCYEKAILHISL